jgi:hypothetical protein
MTYEQYSFFPVGLNALPLSKALKGFTLAENLFIGRRAPSDCLVRSLSLYRYLRSVNIPVQHVIGVRRFPFAAHAWVEYEGAPVLDCFARNLTPIARIGHSL